MAGTHGNRRKAWRILQAPGDPLDVLGGPKVRAFYANITGDPHEVTVDVWAARAAEGKSDPRAPTGKRYERIASAYRAAAEIEGVTPREMQAAVWVRVRAQARGEASSTILAAALTFCSHAVRGERAAMTAAACSRVIGAPAARESAVSDARSYHAVPSASSAADAARQWRRIRLVMSDCRIRAKTRALP